MTQSTEQQLALAAAAGDSVSLARLAELFQHRIFTICLRMLGNRDDAAEVAQDVMLKLVRNIRGFNGSSHVSTWIIRIAMNESISAIRRRKVRMAGSLDAAREGADMDAAAAAHGRLADHKEPSPLSNVEQKETVELLRIALSRIEQDYSGVLILRDMEQMDYQQIADVLGIPVGTVKSRLFRARLALRHEMLRLCPPPAPVRSPQRP